MEPIRQMRNMLPGLRYHHERCNGTGYPDGLTRNNIPLMARIIAVADTFDAMTTNRPYQRCMTLAEGAARINVLRGDFLDEQVVEAFNQAYERGAFQPDAAEQEAEALPPPALSTELIPEPIVETETDLSTR